MDNILESDSLRKKEKFGGTITQSVFWTSGRTRGTYKWPYVQERGGIRLMLVRNRSSHLGSEGISAIQFAT